MLEVRVHLDLPFELLPDDYVLMRIVAPDDLEVRAIAAGDLPTNWRRREDLCRPFGDAWLVERSTALLSAPSAIVDAEPNFLLNPRHPDAHRATVAETVPFPWDERLLQ